MTIVSKDVLVDSLGTRVARIVIAAPDISKHAKAGQFVVLMVNSHGERIPLTVVGSDPGKGCITLIFQELGFTTKLLGRMNEGDRLHAITGPLGHATPIKKYGRVILVGGGVGIAEIYPVARALKGAGNHVTTILGARSKELLILEDKLADVSDELLAATDDGSSGKKGFTTDILAELLAKSKYDFVYSVGPIPMMRKTADVTRPFNVKTIVSLNALMVDATGMCGCCRVTVGGNTLFSCIDGPEFDSHQVDWPELENRSKIYADKEKHICNLIKETRNQSTETRDQSTKS